ncbi:hypothetical protein MNBD_PLANCTO02-852 [hydrothermal vent metagenome]|uniref:DUF676 domain-containing protein n=1 Tax=hydrothermal vent metagenome TaxID=652676 RepID=A0A3B1DJC1_9ZZZZ
MATGFNQTLKVVWNAQTIVLCCANRQCAFLVIVTMNVPVDPFRQLGILRLDISFLPPSFLRIVMLSFLCHSFSFVKMRSTLLVLFCVALMVTSGCASTQLVELRARPASPLAEQLKLYSTGGPKPSERTRLVLRRLALSEKVSSTPYALLKKVTEAHRENPTSESCYALAELNFIAGKKSELRNRKKASEFYLGCVARTYEFLFEPRYKIARNPYDPQFRGACDLYNGALENILRIAQKDGVFQPGQAMAFKTTSGQQIEIAIKPVSKSWKASDFDRFEFVSDYEIRGLKNRYRSFGLGVPLIAVRKRQANHAKMEQHYANNLSFPVTAFLRFSEKGNQKGKALHSTLELQDPLEQTEVVVANYAVPLQSDISTPLAYSLNRTNSFALDTFGLLRPDKAKRVQGLYMVRPYEKGKIPVLMVHGLWSNPMTWMEMFNDLQSNPEIRNHYQFWFYLYPTGKQFIETTADLRDDLQQLRRHIDPNGDDMAVNQMVVVGHSMGGLIAQTMISKSGNNYWNSVSKKTIKQVNATEETKGDLQRIFFFESDSHIKRVITIASPNKGSKLANNFVRWLGHQLIAIPKKTIRKTRQLATLNPNAFQKNENPLERTSLDSLSPRSPILQMLYRSSKPKSVRYHNIVGVADNLPLTSTGDNVVSYKSAHLDNVDSEIIVRDDHIHIHQNPKTINEVSRILLLHLQELRRKNHSGVITVEHTQE